jgi:hypothetical protein
LSPLINLVNIYYCQQLTLSSISSFDSNRLDIKSCFDIGDKQEGINVETKLIDINTNINRDDKVDLPDLEWLTREENTYLLEYYLD